MFRNVSIAGIPNAPATRVSPMSKASGIAMELSGENITQGWGERAALFLRRTHPYGTARLVAHDLKRPIRTVEKWLDGSSSMNADALLAAMFFYGPSFMRAVFPGLGWVEAIAAMTEGEKLEKQIVSTAAKRQRAVSSLRGRA